MSRLDKQQKKSLNFLVGTALARTNVAQRTAHPTTLPQISATKKLSSNSPKKERSTPSAPFAAPNKRSVSFFDDSDSDTPNKPRKKGAKLPSPAITIPKSIIKKATILPMQEQMKPPMTPVKDTNTTFSMNIISSTKRKEISNDHISTLATDNNDGCDNYKTFTKSNIKRLKKNSHPTPSMTKKNHCEKEMGGFLDFSDINNFDDLNSTHTLPPIEKKQKHTDPTVFVKLPQLYSLERSLKENQPETTHSVTITLHYPNVDPHVDTVDTSSTSESLTVHCYDLSTFTNTVHSKLLYPTLNTMHTHLTSLVFSEVHKRFFYNILPAPLYNAHPSRTSVAAQTLAVILAEEMIRKMQSSTLYGQFNRTFPQLKDNAFNNFEQWVIRNISIPKNVLPHTVPPLVARQMLITGLQNGSIRPQSFVPPAVYNHWTLATQSSKDVQIKFQKERDVLFHSPQRTLGDTDLKDALTLRGLTTTQIQPALETFAKHVKASIEEIKKAQYVFHEKGGHPKDVLIKIHEVMRPSLMKKQIGEIYDHVREFDSVDVVFTTSIGPFTLSIPHTIKLTIFYIASYLMNDCMSDSHIEQLATILPPQSSQTPTSQDYDTIESLLQSLHPQLCAGFSPTTFTTATPRLTQQVAKELRIIQMKLPETSITAQYISMLLTGYIITPKIPNLKLPTTSLNFFPQHLAQAIVGSILRYEGLHGGQHRSGGGHQAAVPPLFLQASNRYLGVNFEAFASPFNAFFTTYCSAFPDVDTPFGSVGSFFHFNPSFGNIFVNPPFVPDTISASIIHAEQLLALSNTTHILPNNSILSAQDNGLLFFFVFPYKPKEIYTKWITTSPFCSLYTVLPKRQHIYTVGRQEFGVSKERYYRPARHDTLCCVLQNDKSRKMNPVTHDALSNMFKYFLIYNPNPNEDHDEDKH